MFSYIKIDTFLIYFYIIKSKIPFSILNIMKAHRTRKTPFCRVCFNAELPSEIYSSHYTKDFSKDSKGIITCPTILKSECGYCHKKGHWKKYCPILKRRNKEYVQRARSQSFEEEYPKLTSQIIASHNQILSTPVKLAKIMPIFDDDFMLQLRLLLLLINKMILNCVKLLKNLKKFIIGLIAAAMKMTNK